MCFLDYSIISHFSGNTLNHKENLFVILTMKANTASYSNEKNVWDGWRKKQRIEISMIWLNHLRTELRHEPLDI